MFNVVSQNSTIDVISHKTMLKGNFTFGDTVKIDGMIDGKVFVEKNDDDSNSGDTSPSILIIGQDAFVNAEISCDSIVIEGLVRGDITARGTIEIRNTGVLFGNVKARNIVVRPGGALEGTCSVKRS